jgi:hypothetical protein
MLFYGNFEFIFLFCKAPPKLPVYNGVLGSIDGKGDAANAELSYVSLF